ncbi:MAG TPA: quinol:electron acceptor oxidoreductase subunit ActD, partial [Verrucomicrobiae bacterium]|nr:quinol:electron acceptor oxidoreductase subunit ActD [Verrucomicrobiae bacterium]
FGAFPPSYELTILLGSFGAIFGMLFMNRLPRLHHPLLKHKQFALATHDKFFVVIETDDPKFSETETRKLLETAGSKLIQVVED